MDYELSYEESMRRLHVLGASPEERSRVTYVHPTGPLIVRLASLELRNFLKAMELKPDVRISEATAILRDIEQADVATAHFWFLGANPHSYDFFTARNVIAFRAMRDAEGVALPDNQKPEEISYPRNPLKRLVAMHASSREFVTGLTYISPWPRDDAQRR